MDFSASMVHDLEHAEGRWTLVQIIFTEVENMVQSNTIL